MYLFDLCFFCVSEGGSEVWGKGAKKNSLLPFCLFSRLMRVGKNTELAGEKLGAIDVQKSGRGDKERKAKGRLSGEMIESGMDKVAMAGR